MRISIDRKEFIINFKGKKMFLNGKLFLLKYLVEVSAGDLVLMKVTAVQPCTQLFSTGAEHIHTKC